MALRRVKGLPVAVQAVILAGGLGTRLWPLTIRVPKPLLPVMDRPLLAHLIDRLPGGVDEVFLAVSFQAEEIRKWVDSSGDPALEGRGVQVIKEDPPLGTGGALAHLADHAGLGAQGGPLFVLNGDLLADIDLEGLLRVHQDQGPLATIALVSVEDPSRYGIVDLDGQGRIRRFVEKPSPEEAPSSWANAGAYVVDAAGLEGIPRGRAVSLEREVFPGWVDREAGMRGRAHRGLWVDCGTRESYLQAHRELRKRQAEAGGPGATLGDGSHVQSGVEVAGDARVERSVIHRGAVVARGARVVESIVGEGAVVGAGADVYRSIVAAGARLREGARVAYARVVDEAQ